MRNKIVVVPPKEAAYLTAKAPIEKLAKIVANPAGKATLVSVLNSRA